MSKLLHIAAALRIPHEWVTKRAGILGQSGGGKTTTASSLVEELLKNNLPVTVVDPTDAWWGLLSSADGKSDGYPVTVLGGDHGHLPLEESAGKVIADLVAESAPPLVLCTAGFSNAGARRFVADFAERLFERNRTALHFVLDEADEFAPQRIPKGGERCYGAIDKLVRKGRIRGIGVTMICQRSAAIAKDILSQCDTLIAHRTSHPRDLDPVLEWMRVHATREQLEEVHDSIAKLANGEAWVMSPQFLSYFGRVQMRDRETFNSSATPKPGERRLEPKRLAPVDLAALKSKMAETIERAAADDPRALRRRIAELESTDWRSGPAAQAINARDTKINDLNELLKVKAAKADPRVRQFVEQVNRLERQVAAVQEVSRGLIALAAEIRTAGSIPRTFFLNENHEIPTRIRVDGADAPHSVNGKTVKVGGLGDLERRERKIGGGERKLLEALARRHPTALTRPQLAALSGYTPTGGTFTTYMPTLKRLGLVAERGGVVALTPEGLAEVKPLVGQVQSAEEIRAMWRANIGGGEWKVLQVLLAAGGGPMLRAEVAERSGYTVNGGTFTTYVPTLKRLGLVVEDRDGLAAVRELLQ